VDFVYRKVLSGYLEKPSRDDRVAQQQQIKVKMFVGRGEGRDVDRCAISVHRSRAPAGSAQKVEACPGNEHI
jgi:hypothetical protein